MKKILIFMFMLISASAFSQGFPKTTRPDTLTQAFTVFQTQYGTFGVWLDSLLSAGVGSGGTTDLSTGTRTSTTFPINNSNGTGVTIDNATIEGGTNVAGLMTPIEKGQMTQQTIAYSATISANLNNGNRIYIDMTGDAAIAAPSNSVAGEEITYILTANGANRTATFASVVFKEEDGVTDVGAEVITSGSTKAFTFKVGPTVLHRIGGASGSSLPSVPAAEILGTEIFYVGDSTVTFQKVVDQVRDSTIFSAATYADIVNISTPLKVGDRIKVKNTGAEYLVQSNPVTGYAADGVAVISTGGVYAVLQPQNGMYDIRHFGASAEDGADDTGAFRKAGNFSRYTKGDVIIPKGVWNIDENLSSYGPNLDFYGSIIGTNKDSCIIKVDSVTALSGNVSIFNLRGNEIKNLTFSITGNPSYAVSANRLDVISLKSKNSVVENCTFIKCNLGSGNTAGNTYIAQFTPQNEILFQTTTVDAETAGTNVVIALTNTVQSRMVGEQVVIETSGVGDTTYITAVNLINNTITVASLSQSYLAGADVKTFSYGFSNTRILNCNFYDMYGGTGVIINSGQYLINGCVFKNIGSATGHHATYNQAGFGTISNCWFEGGEGHQVADGNKQDYRATSGLKIVDCTFFNTKYAIELTFPQNPISTYLGTQPKDIYGNRVLAEGVTIDRCVFYTSPNSSSLGSLSSAASFGGYDANSRLKGRASLKVSNCFFLGRTGTFSNNALNGHIDTHFSNNVCQISDTTATDGVGQSYNFSKGAKISDNVFVAKGDDQITFSGDSCNVSHNDFYFSTIYSGSTPPTYISFNDSYFQNNTVTIDTMLRQAFFSNDVLNNRGGTLIGNTFKVLRPKQTGVECIAYYVNQELPNVINNTFVNCGIGLRNISNSDKIKNKKIKNNDGLMMMSYQAESYLNGTVPTGDQCDVMPYYDKTNYSIGGIAGQLVVMNADSTVSIATHTQSPIGVQITSRREDATGFISLASTGSIIRAFVKDTVNIGDLLVIDTTTAGVLKTIGQNSTEAKFVCRALEQVRAWNSATTYVPGDVVSRGGVTYKCFRTNVNSGPQYVYNGGTGANYWRSWPVRVEVVQGTGGAELPIANETQQGILELATAAETATGTDNTRAVTPAGLNSVISCTDSTWTNIDTIFHRSYDCSIDTSLTRQIQLSDADGDTEVKVEQLTDDDIIRLNAAGNEVAQFYNTRIDFFRRHSIFGSGALNAGSAAQTALTNTSALQTMQWHLDDGGHLNLYDSSVRRLVIPNNGILEKSATKALYMDAQDSLVYLNTSGTWTPTLTLTGTDTVVVNHGGTWSRSGNTVTYSLSFAVGLPSTAQSNLHGVQFTLPVSSTLTTHQIKGTTSMIETGDGSNIAFTAGDDLTFQAVVAAVSNDGYLSYSVTRLIGNFNAGNNRFWITITGNYTVN